MDVMVMLCWSALIPTCVYVIAQTAHVIIPSLAIMAIDMIACLVLGFMLGLAEQRGFVDWLVVNGQFVDAPFAWAFWLSSGSQLDDVLLTLYLKISNILFLW